MRVAALILPHVLGLAASLSLRADTLSSFGAGATGANLAANYLGEKFTPGGSGLYKSINFDFITTGGNPYAIGTGFLLSQQYLGDPTTLSSTTAGYLGSAAASGNFYSFGSALTLQSATTYYFYENALAAPTTVAGALTTRTDVEYFYSTLGGNFTAPPGASAAFTVTGTPVAGVSQVPEPSSLVLLATGLGGAAATIRRLRS